MSPQNTVRAAPAATEHDPQVNRLVDPTITSISISSKITTTTIQAYDSDWPRTQVARIIAGHGGIVEFSPYSHGGDRKFVVLYQERSDGIAEAAT
jgi:hypothetical protein